MSVPGKNFSFRRGTNYDKVFERRTRGPYGDKKCSEEILSAAAISAATIAVPTFSASAAIVCQGNVCWHTHEAYDFPHEADVVVHEDNWHWGPHEKFQLREHEGRGYWRGGKWAAW